MRIRISIIIALILAAALSAGSGHAWQDGSSPLESARRAYEASEYENAVQLLQSAATTDPRNGDIYILLTKSYIELAQYDAAYHSGERAVAIAPQSSVNHHILGKAYGEKADHSSFFTALSFAKKTYKEFEVAVGLDAKNYSVRQDLIEYYCRAPGIAGGDEEKGLAQIAVLQPLDAAEWHYALGNCRRQKKDFTSANTEFTKALESGAKRPELIYDVGDYAMKQSQPERLLAVANAGEKVDPADPRGLFYRGVAFVLRKERPEQVEKLLRDYVKRAPRRSGYPRPAAVHEWLGRLFEQQGKMGEAVKEYEAALQTDPKNKNAHEALKRLGKR